MCIRDREEAALPHGGHGQLQRLPAAVEPQGQKAVKKGTQHTYVLTIKMNAISIAVDDNMTGWTSNGQPVTGELADRYVLTKTKTE